MKIYLIILKCEMVAYYTTYEAAQKRIDTTPCLEWDASVEIGEI